MVGEHSCIVKTKGGAFQVDETVDSAGCCDGYGHGGVVGWMGCEMGNHLVWDGGLLSMLKAMPSKTCLVQQATQAFWVLEWATP